MTDNEKKNILSKIVERIKNKIDVKEIIVFGSYLKNTAEQDADIDIVVILNETGIANNYKEKFKRKRKVTLLLNDIRKNIPLDILVYSSEEWEKLQQINSSFIKEINMNGLRIA
ncbi:MAG TPA: nucleotidyltransferase domain-containing protein [Ignavibacteria bacterium]|nr:nucleotidyltransferase domain-containing protein [Ignavibacteria bacterium]